MICLVNGGILNGLQFEQDDPPHRLLVRCVKQVPISYVPASIPMYMSEPNYKIKAISYTGTRVYVNTEGNGLDGEMKNEIFVYEVEREW